VTLNCANDKILSALASELLKLSTTDDISLKISQDDEVSANSCIEGGRVVEKTQDYVGVKAAQFDEVINNSGLSQAYPTK
jgi:hypothetical protein